MGTIDIIEDTFTCHQEGDLAVFNILEKAKAISTTVSGKDVFFEAMNAIKAAQDIKGVAFLYSEKYQSDVEYEKFIKETIENIQKIDQRRYTITFKSAIIQFLENIHTFPKPIVGAMDGYIAPTSFAANLAFDLRIATDKTNFILPDLKFGLPPSPPLSFYLVHSLGHQKATDLILTKSEITAQEALDLGLLTQVVSKKNLKDSCIDKLRQLTAISEDALIESRRMLKPSLKKMREYMDKGFEGTIRCMYKMKYSR
jgi:enoyl-CoA hydratase/carnithine racemase